MRYQYLLVLLASCALPAIALAAEDTSSLGFVPLTSIPGIDAAGNAATLPDFLNNVYKLSIGLAAVLAVLQIIRAGIMYMGGDSVTEKKEARSLITLAIGGLVLVLSPVIVFSIINPKILDLKIDGLDTLLTQDTSFTSTAQRVLWTDTSATRDAARTRCTTDGGTPVFTCQKPGSGTAYTVPATQACKSGEDDITVCNAPKDAPTSDASCVEQYASIQSLTAGQTCSAARGFAEIPVGCCKGGAAGAVCCGQSKDANKAAPVAYGWKAWYDVPSTGGKKVSTLLQSKLFDTKDLCVANTTNPDALPAGSTYDKTKGFACTCGAPLSEQGDTCKPW